MACIIIANLFKLWTWIVPRSSRHGNHAVQWVIGGCSILSFPLAIAGILLHVGVAVLNYGYSTRCKMVNNHLGDTNDAEKVRNMIFRFKDPWYDNIRILRELLALVTQYYFPIFAGNTWFSIPSPKMSIKVSTWYNKSMLDSERMSHLLDETTDAEGHHHLAKIPSQRHATSTILRFRAVKNAPIVQPFNYPQCNDMIGRSQISPSTRNVQLVQLDLGNHQSERRPAYFKIKP
ncbi:hypothetical protein BCR34DRAFT_668824 [Clohesyomyces aquaticus]|uniref:Uncharacterized protein n=1 Tax=Clohesyomyces aquaticus TaxID=1231657 RepID=A0A1Y1YJ70_9PLEO|nr:hypothetical protein BCR34DRAFT_668824 [Clohesyomyces aquaticus]